MDGGGRDSARPSIPLIPNASTNQPATNLKDPIMASNRLPDINDKLFPLGDDMIDGLTKHGDEVGVKQFTAAVLTPKLADARQAQGAYETAQTAETDATSVRNVANSNAKGFIGTGRDILAKALGKKPSRDWEALGYPSGSLAVPDSIETRLAVLTGMRDYLQKNPAKEVATEDITFTQAEAETLRKALSDARGTVNEAVAARVLARGTRDTAVGDLRTALSGLIGELGHIPLGDDSPKWYYFGLVPPAGSAAPGVPDGLSGHQVGPTSAVAGWAASPRATKYRPFKKVEGVDSDFVALDLTSETQVLLENLPPKAVVHLQVTAYNAAGESAKSAEISITLS
jgi:hypothetical protein